MKKKSIYTRRGISSNTSFIHTFSTFNPPSKSLFHSSLSDRSNPFPLFLSLSLLSTSFYAIIFLSTWVEGKSSFCIASYSHYILTIVQFLLENRYPMVTIANNFHTFWLPCSAQKAIPSLVSLISFSTFMTSILSPFPVIFKNVLFKGDLIKNSPCNHFSYPFLWRKTHFHTLHKPPSLGKYIFH